MQSPLLQDLDALQQRGVERVLRREDVVVYSVHDAEGRVEVPVPASDDNAANGRCAVQPHFRSILRTTNTGAHHELNITSTHKRTHKREHTQPDTHVHVKACTPRETHRDTYTHGDDHLSAFCMHVYLTLSTHQYDMGTVTSIPARGEKIRRGTSLWQTTRNTDVRDKSLSRSGTCTCNEKHSKQTERARLP